MKHVFSGLFFALLLVGVSASCAGISADIKTESAFWAGTRTIYAVQTNIRIDQKKGRVERLVLVLTLYRAEVFHLVKAGVIRGVTPRDLLGYKPLKPIYVKLKGGRRVLDALTGAWRGKGDLVRVFARKGPWRQLKNYEFISLEQRTGKRKHGKRGGK